MRYYAHAILVERETGHMFDEQVRHGETEAEARKRALNAIGSFNPATSYARVDRAGPEVCTRCGSDGVRQIAGTPLHTCTHCGADL